MHMIILLLMMWMGSLCAQSECDSKNCSLVNSNLTGIPINVSVELIKLDLSQNIITLDNSSKDALRRYPNLTELNLSSNKIQSLPNDIFSGLTNLEVLILKENYITTVESLAFQGLEKLKILDLGYNQIVELPTKILLPFKKLEALNLQNNNITNLDIKEALKDLNSTIHLTLSENPWNCSCALMNMSEWLTGSTIILEHENITRCATPEYMRNYTVKEIWTLPDIQKCKDSGDTISTTTATDIPSTSSTTAAADIPSTLGNLTTSEVINGTAATSTTGNSWRFLVGVVVVGIVTSLLILAAIKFPRWYDFLLSYNHQRLKEEEPYMFEEEFNVDFSMNTNDKIQDEEETVVVFEQTHSFVPEDDGFIEDKYIDEKDMRAES